MNEDTSLPPDEVLETPAPALTADEAENVARELFGIRGQVRQLDSERDQNFRLTSENGDQYVLKIANPAENAEVIDLQARALSWIARTDPDLPVPRIQSTREGQQSGSIAIGSRNCIVRAVSYLDGALLDEVTPTVALGQSLGTSLARMDIALQGFFHHGAGHE
ncbi:MAG: phosphotransferase, partial [Gammaproteobacteria bacterium]